MTALREQLSLLLPVLLCAAGSVLYHLAAKAVPETIDPGLVLVVAYAAALGASIAMLCLSPAQAPGSMPARSWTFTAVTIGLALVMIHLGYLLMYRAAWSISVAPALTNGLVAALLVPIGMAAFGERLSATRGAGVALCVVGVLLLKR